MKDDRAIKQKICTEDDKKDTYMSEGIIVGLFVGTIIGIFVEFGSIISILAPSFGILFGLMIGMCIKKKSDNCSLFSK